MLASDPHLEVNRLPSIWYEVVLRWGRHDYAIGATLPGCPLMAVGRTPRLAWGVTYLHADTSDYFIEDCRPGGSTGWQYRRGADRWIDFQVREELIERKGAAATTLQVYHNPQGNLAVDLSRRDLFAKRGPDIEQSVEVPEVVSEQTSRPQSDAISVTESATNGATDSATDEPPVERAEESSQAVPGKYLSAQWIGSGEGAGRSIGCWLDVIGSQSVAEAMDVVRDSPPPSLVWVFADHRGHIGRQASGWLPRRAPGHSGLLPVPAWETHTHWLGRQPVESLPRLYDPPEGYLASANEDLNRTGQWLLNTHALPDYRKRRIVQCLHPWHDATVRDMQRLQYDVLSLQARDLLALFLPHLPEGPMVESLSEWDLRFDPKSTNATLFQHLYRHVLLEIFGHEKGIGWRRMFYLCTRMGYSSMVLTAIDRLLVKEESLWWRRRDKGELIRLAAERAIEEPVEPWGEVNAFHFTNRFFQQGRVGRLLGFQSAKKPLPGCQATPFQGHLLATATRESTFAPSYHFVTDLGTDEAWTNLPGGASESRFSKWYHNDIDRWLSGEYRRLSPDEDELSDDGST